jgi:hypothetical protein
MTRKESPLMQTHLAIAALSLVLASTHAQERAASNSLDDETNWSVLSNKINSSNVKLDAATTRLEQIELCGKEHKLYSPGHKDADAKGCLTIVASAPSKLNLQSHTKTLCTNLGYHIVTSTCAAGEELLSCVGGPGHQYEYGEFWVLQPNFTNRSCTGYISQPLCYTGHYYGQIVITAICYKP